MLRKRSRSSGRRGVALDQFVPGKARRLPGIDLLDRVGGEIHRPSHVVERDLAALHAEQSELQYLNDAAQRRVAGQHLHQALRLGQHVHLRRELARPFRTTGRSEQKRCRLWAVRWKGTGPYAATSVAPVRRPPRRPVRWSAHRPRRRWFRIAGNAFSKAASRSRHAMWGEMSWLTSVVMAKWVAAYQDASKVRRSDTTMTGQACAGRQIDRADDEGSNRFHGMISDLG